MAAALAGRILLTLLFFPALDVALGVAVVLADHQAEEVLVVSAAAAALVAAVLQAVGKYINKIA